MDFPLNGYQRPGASRVWLRAFPLSTGALSLLSQSPLHPPDVLHHAPSSTRSMFMVSITTEFKTFAMVCAGGARVDCFRIFEYVSMNEERCHERVNSCVCKRRFTTFYSSRCCIQGYNKHGILISLLMNTKKLGIKF